MVPTSGSSFSDIHFTLPSPFLRSIPFFRDYFILYLQFLSNFSCLSWSQVSRGRLRAQNFHCLRDSVRDVPAPFFPPPLLILFIRFIFLVVIVWRGRRIYSRMIVSFRLCRHHSRFSSLSLSHSLPRSFPIEPLASINYGAGNFYWKKGFLANSVDRRRFGSLAASKLISADQIQCTCLCLAILMYQNL